MRICLLAVGTRMPDWINTGFNEYARRLPPECRLELTEVAPAKRTKNTVVERAVAEEAKRLLAATPKGARVVALDERGKMHTTHNMASRLRGWQQQGSDVALLVGGSDGLDTECLDRAGEHWSLSPLTLPHGLVRVVVAEQIYRAWSTLHNHPYHRQ